MTAPVLEVINVSKSFGGLIALDGVNLNVKQSTISLLIGPNGSGKTTLINVISGVMKPDSGTIRYKGMNITGLPAHDIYRLGILRTWQIPQPFLNLSVLENVLVADGHNPGEGFFSSLFKIKSWRRHEAEATEKAYKILRLVKLDHLWDTEAYKLSGGQMKLLEIARALMSGANVLMIDEPIAGVNPVLADEIFTTMVNVRNTMNTTFLIVEHRLEIAVKYTEWCYAMFNGKVIAEGVPQEVLNNTRVVEAYLGG